jgi:malate dehydrogenase (oxaloacetate-decarboxylating)
MCEITNRGGMKGELPDALGGADALVALSKPGPGTVRGEWISRMAEDAIVFACANPVPEIWPWEAKEAGARIVATGRGDFPNQVNNSLGFPGIFRGTLDVRASAITDEMCIEAAKALARTAEDKGLSEDYIVPRMDEWEVFPREAAAVGMKAIEQGIARKVFTRDELTRHSESIIRDAREKTRMLMEHGFIRHIDEEV